MNKNRTIEFQTAQDLTSWGINVIITILNYTTIFTVTQAWSLVTVDISQKPDRMDLGESLRLSHFAHLPYSFPLESLGRERE